MNIFSYFRFAEFVEGSPHITEAEVTLNIVEYLNSDSLTGVSIEFY